MGLAQREQSKISEEGVHLPPLTPHFRAANIASVQIGAGANFRCSQRPSAPASRLVVSDTGDASISISASFRSFAINLPAPLPSCAFCSDALLHGPAQLRDRYHWDSDSCQRSPHRQVSPLASCHLPTVPSSNTWYATASLSPPPQRAVLVPGFATLVQARRHTPPKQVRHPTDRQFASGYSPPRLTTTQLPSATELWPTPAGTCTLHVARPRGRTLNR
jgi:hypothetical protein